MIIIAQLRWLKVFLKWLTIILSHVLVRNLFIYLFILFLTVLVFTAVWAFLQLQRAGATLSLQCTGFSFQWPLWGSVDSRHAGFSSWCHMGSGFAGPRLQKVGSVVAHGLRCSAASRIFPNQGSNQYLLHWQADS